MKKPRIVLFIAFAAMAAIVLGKFLAEKRLPPGRVYKGKTVSQWVDLCVEKPEERFYGGLEEYIEPGMKEIHELGPEAIPYLIEAIKRKPGLYTKPIYAKVYTNLPIFISQKLPIPRGPFALHFRAYCALERMGPSARSAVPFLVSQFKADNHELDYALAALTFLGTNAVEAIPCLTNTFQSTNQKMRWKATFVLASVYPDYSELMPRLLKQLKGTNVNDRGLACYTLGEIRPRTLQITTILKEALDDPDPLVKKTAQDALNSKK